MVLVIPPADVTEAVSPVAVNVWTRDNAASKRVHPAGFLSATTRNWMGALAVGAAAAGAGGVDACCVEHPAVIATIMTRTQLEFRMGFLPFLRTSSAYYDAMPSTRTPGPNNVRAVPMSKVRQP
ncbi:MAG: hypothetical protein ISP49_06210 [Reyranella sp.]|nr:hypothetical protein [Reyranella sp.]MBL6651165.1 hypothetical protein [Reyranella sp.]